MYSGKEHPQLELNLLQQLRLGTEVYLPQARTSVKCHTVTAGAMMDMAKRKCFKVVRSLTGTLPRPDVMNLCWCVAQLQVATYHAAKVGYAGVIESFCLSHDGPPADKAKHRYRMNSIEKTKIFYTPSEFP